MKIKPYRDMPVADMKKIASQKHYKVLLRFYLARRTMAMDNLASAFLQGFSEAIEKFTKMLNQIHNPAGDTSWSDKK